MNPRILIVEDEPFVHEALQRTFDGEPVDLVWAGDAASALRLLENDDVHLVCADETTGGEPAVEWLVEVRRRWPDVVRVMLAGPEPVDVDLDRISDAGIHRVIAKPWDEDELGEMFRDEVEDLGRAKPADVAEDLPIPVVPIDTADAEKEPDEFMADLASELDRFDDPVD